MVTLDIILGNEKQNYRFCSDFVYTKTHVQKLAVQPYRATYGYEELDHCGPIGLCNDTRGFRGNGHVVRSGYTLFHVSFTLTSPKVTNLKPYSIDRQFIHMYYTWMVFTYIHYDGREGAESRSVGEQVLGSLAVR